MLRGLEVGGDQARDDGAVHPVVIHGRHPVREVAVIDGAGEDGSLVEDDLFHPLVDGVLGEQLDELAVALLTEPQEATGALREVGRRPRQVEEVRIARIGQVDAHATGLDTDAEQTDLTRLEGVHDAEPVAIVDLAGDHLRTAPLLTLVVDAGRVGELLGQMLDGRVVSREDHHLLAVAQSLTDDASRILQLTLGRKLTQVVQLDDGLAALCGVESLLVRTRPTQPLDEILLSFLVDGAVGQLDPRLTNLALGGGLPNLVGQATNHELLEFLRQFALAILRTIHLHEVLLRSFGPETSAHLEDGVKLIDTVDQGRRGHDDRVAGDVGEHLRHRGSHRIRVTNQVALIRDEDAALRLHDLHQRPSGEPLEHRVADDDDIVAVDVVRVVRVADGNGEVGAHLHLALPQVDQTLGTGDDGLVALGRQVRRDGDGLAKTSVVC